MNHKPILPPTYFLAAILSILLLRFLLPITLLIPFPWHLLGIPILAAGLLLSIWADRLFHKADTTVKPFQPSTALVTAGPYRFSRHPMYLGFTAALAGLAILLGALTPFFVVPVYGLLMDLIFIIPEEKAMEQTFGEEYQEYRARVRRWI